MTKQDLIKNETFMAVATTDAVSLLASKANQEPLAFFEKWKDNEDFQAKVADMISLAADVTLEQLSK